MNKWAILGILLFIGAATFYVLPEKKKPNILIVSIDSFRRDPAFTYNWPEADAPNLTRMASKSFFFKNFFTPRSWGNLNYWLARMPAKFWEENGYETLGLPWLPRALRKLDYEEAQTRPGNFYIYINHESFRFGIDHLKTKLLQERDRPFFVQVHIKELHPPMYRDSVTATDKLSSPSAARMRTYLDRPQDFPEKTLLFYLLFDPVLGTHHHWRTDAAVDTLIERKTIPAGWGRVRRINFQASDLFTNLWKKSAGFEEDLQLLRELYALKMRYLDAHLAEILDLYGNQRLKNETVLVVLGNFGFSMMEHGSLFNSVETFDEFIGTNMFIHLPGQLKGEVVQTQASLKSVAQWIGDLVNKPNAVHNLKDTIHDPFIVARNYTGEIIAGRDENQWKFVIDILSGRRQLFDLKNDPGETKDLFYKDAAAAAKMEARLWKEVLGD